MGTAGPRKVDQEVSCRRRHLWIAVVAHPSAGIGDLGPFVHRVWTLSHYHKEIVHIRFPGRYANGDAETPRRGECEIAQLLEVTKKVSTT